MAQVHNGRSPVSTSLQSVLDPHSSQAECAPGPLPFSSLASSTSQHSAHGSTTVAPAPQQHHNQSSRRLPPAASSGGGNTELRAQIRREREAARNGSKEAEKAAPTASGSAPSTSTSAAVSDALSILNGNGPRKQSASGYAADSHDDLDKHSNDDGDDHKSQQQETFRSEQQNQWHRVPSAGAFDGRHERAQTQPLNLTGRSEMKPSFSESSAGSQFVVNPKRLSTGSAVAAAVRKLEEDAKAHLSSTAHNDDRRSSKDRRSDERAQIGGFMNLDGYGPSRGSAGPPESFDQSFGMEALQAAFSAKYYELASKCKNWERYAAKLRAQTEALEVENRVLREANSKQEEHIRALETENIALKDHSALRENRAREVESRLTSLERRLSFSHAAPSLSGVHLDQFQDLRSALEAAYVAPSPPNTSTSQDLTLSAGLHGGHSNGPFHSSTIVYADDQRQRQPLRAPTPLSNHVLPPNGQRTQEAGQSAGYRTASHPATRNHSSNGQRDSIVMYDAANRDHADLYGEGRASRLGNRTMESLHSFQSMGASTSMSEYTTAAPGIPSGVPVSGPATSVALTSQALAAFEHHHRRHTQGSSQVDQRMQEPPLPARSRLSPAPRTTNSPPRLPPMAGQKRSTVDPPQSTLHPSMAMSHSQPYMARQISGTLPKVRSNNSFDPDMMRSSASLPTLPAVPSDEERDTSGPEQYSHAQRLQLQHLQAQNHLHNRVRSGSAISDAGTVTGWPHARAQTHNDTLGHNNILSNPSAASSTGNLTDNSSQRQRLRRTSMSQQQQLAQIQAQREATLTGSEGVTQPPSRSGSRSSNLSGEGTSRRRGSKTRSRAGSASVHDSIPIIKDDIFSDGRHSSMDDPSRVTLPITHSQSHPILGSIQSRNSSLGPHGPPPANSNGMGRGPMPFGNITNTHLQHQHRSSGSGGGEPYRASTSDGALTSLKPGFGRTASGSSLASQSSTSQQTSSSGQLAHQSSNISQTTVSSSFHAQEPSTSSSTEGLPQIDEELTAEAKRGAHRRLYIALREELPEAELSKFERYVHRYDALEIPLDGPRGLVNRVKKLLILSDPTLKDRPAELKRRKDLAREFERIVRVDTE